MAERRMYGDYLGHVDTFAQQEVGSRREQFDATYGWIECVYVYNGDAAPLALGDLVMFKASTLSLGTAVKATGAKIPKNQLLGVVAGAAIPVGYFGWAVCRGVVLTAGDGNVTANSSLISDATAGRVKNATLTNADEVAACFGYAQEADAAAGSLFRAYVNI